MDLQIRGNGVAVTDDLRAHAEQRAARLDHLVDPVDDAKLELRKIHNRQGPDTVTAQITLQSGKQVVRAEDRATDAKAAIDGAVAKLDRQVRRVLSRHDPTKNKRSPSIRTSPHLAPPVVVAGADGVAEAEASGGLVRTKRFPVKPMDVDEAIEQMELLGHDFYLFPNSEDGGFSVVYRRRDGDYGLLVPEKG